MLSLVFTWYYFESIYKLIFDNKIFYGHYEGKSEFLPGIIPPRSSGLGRMALVILIFFLIFFKVNSFKEKILLTIIIIPGIILTQSRIIIIFNNFYCFHILKLPKFKKLV